jgi:hypothetical protein
MSSPTNVLLNGDEVASDIDECISMWPKVSLFTPTELNTVYGIWQVRPSPAFVFPGPLPTKGGIYCCLQLMAVGKFCVGRIALRHYTPPNKPNPEYLTLADAKQQLPELFARWVPIGSPVSSPTSHTPTPSTSGVTILGLELI